MGSNDLLSQRLIEVWSNDLKRLVAVETGVELKGDKRDRDAHLFERFLEAAKILRHAINKSPRNRKYTPKHLRSPDAP